VCMGRFKSGACTYLCELDKGHLGACQAPAVQAVEEDTL
jgi:hypothetical protein